MDNAYDLSVYIANWPAKRKDHWLSLLKARAIENQAYVIGVNRVGIDGNKIDYKGDSCIFDPWGKELFHCRDAEMVHTQHLEFEDLKKIRDKFTVWQDGDRFTIRSQD